MSGHAIRILPGLGLRGRDSFLADAPGWYRERRLFVLLLIVLFCGCYGGDTDLSARGKPTDAGSADGASSQRLDHAKPAHLNPATAPGPPIPPPQPMGGAVVKKFFLFPADKPMIPYPKPESFSGGFFVDPSSGKLAWKAMVCTATDCPGRKPGVAPEPFAIRHAYLYPLPNGDTPNLFDDGKGPQACPHCGRSQTITEYLTPEDESRKTRLEAELQQAYADRIAARAAGKQSVDAGRSPQEIMDEINSIPRHFLLDKDMDYGPLQAAAEGPLQFPGE